MSIRVFLSKKTPLKGVKGQKHYMAHGYVVYKSLSGEAWTCVAGDLPCAITFNSKIMKYVESYEYEQTVPFRPDMKSGKFTCNTAVALVRFLSSGGRLADGCFEVNVRAKTFVDLNELFVRIVDCESEKLHSINADMSKRRSNRREFKTKPGTFHI